MNVVHISTVHSHFDTRIFNKELQSLSNAGYSTTLLTHTEGTETHDGIRIHGLGEVKSRKQRWKSLPSTYFEAKNLDADVYHLHDPELLPVGRLLSHRTNAALIYDIHENYDSSIKYRNYIPNNLKPILSNSIIPIQSKLASSFEALIPATEWISEDFEDRGHNQVVTVRNFPILEDISYDLTNPKREHEFVMSFVGNLAKNRGLVRMIDVTRRLRDHGYDVGLWIIGPFSNGAIEEVVSTRITEQGLENNVRLFGYVDYQKIFSILNASDIGLLLLDPIATNRAIPTKMLEYMASGIPVVANRTQGTEKYIPTDCGTIVDDDITEQTNAIENLLDNTQQRHSYGKNARMTAVTEYNWTTEKEKLLSLYKRIEEQLGLDR